MIGRVATASTAVARALTAWMLLGPAAIAGETVVADRGADRTAYDRPDLGGIWDFSTLVPLQRPEEMGDRATLTDEEATELEATAAATPTRTWSEPAARLGDDRRTSLIVEPVDGRLPPTRPDVKRQSAGEDLDTDLPVRIRVGGIGTDGPENRGLSERCLLGFNAGPPILPGFYNQNVQIVQTPDYVVIHTEMIHDARIVPLDGRPALPSDIRPWLGSSVGHWQGDTLVIETSNFRDEIPSFTPTPFAAVGSARNLRLTERLRRLDENTLHYEFNVDDPDTYTRPFTVVLRMKRSDHRIYEYACHEGNYPLRHILAGARALEKGDEAEDGRE